MHGNIEIDSLNIRVYMCICIYTYVYMYTHVNTHIFSIEIVWIQSFYLDSFLILWQGTYRGCSMLTNINVKLS